MSAAPFTECLPLLRLLEAIFTESTHETWTREMLLVILNGMKHDPLLFDPVVVEEWEKQG